VHAVRLRTGTGSGGTGVCFIGMQNTWEGERQLRVFALGPEGAHLTHRVATGMRGAYGKPYGLSARVKINQVMFSIRTTLKGEDAAVEALRKVPALNPKPTPSAISLHSSGHAAACVYLVSCRAKKISRQTV
jgi:hypothetical protein